jgi:hypothetical protein
VGGDSKSLIDQYEEIARAGEPGLWRDSLIDELERKGRTLDNGYDSFDLIHPDIIAGQQLGIAWAIVPEKAREALEREFHKGMQRCESPIEKFMLPWLLVATARYSNWEPLCLLPGESALLPKGRVAVVPQLPIGKYRVDFALAGRRSGSIGFFIVECDGKEYHVAKDDAVRDAVLRKNKSVLGIRRLSGSVIRNDARGWSARIARENLDAWRGQP